LTQIAAGFVWRLLKFEEVLIEKETEFNGFCIIILRISRCFDLRF